MNLKTNNNHFNRKFDGVIDNCSMHLRGKMPDACGYSSDILLDRLMQRVVEIALPAYATVVDELCKTTSEIFPSEGVRINCGQANMEVESGRIGFTSKQWAINAFEFLAHWLFCLFSIVNVRRNCNVNTPSVLVFGVGEESLFNGGNDERFVRYCRNGPIDPLRNGRRFFVQSVKQRGSYSDNSFSYMRDPVSGLLREASMGFFGRVRLLINHMALFFAYLIAISRSPQLSLLGRDMAYSQVMFELDRRRLIDAVIFTTSNFMRQPLWSRVLSGASVHTVWYAQNFKPIIYKSDALESDVPNVRWIRGGTHWVWTIAYGEYLKSLGLGADMQIIGPVLWYPPVQSTPDKNSIKIALFDVSPFHDNVALLYGDISNYNHPDNLFLFMRDVTALKAALEERFGMPVTLSLKTKRGYNAAYDRPYFDHLEALAAQGVITLEHHAMNMYSLISGSHLVIVYPFSSPAYIADFLGVPSVYYDPTGAVSRHDFGDAPSLIDFADSPASLLNVATLALSKVFTNEAIFNNEMHVILCRRNGDIDVNAVNRAPFHAPAQFGLSPALCH